MYLRYKIGLSAERGVLGVGQEDSGQWTSLEGSCGENRGSSRCTKQHPEPADVMHPEWCLGWTGKEERKESRKGRVTEEDGGKRARQKGKLGCGLGHLHGHWQAWGRLPKPVSS